MYSDSSTATPFEYDEQAAGMFLSTTEPASLTRFNDQALNRMIFA
jgi:hypothetical protein